MIFSYASTSAKNSGNSNKQERLIRFCIRDGTTLDFTRQSGSIGEDLGGRDFTINAIAWAPATGLLDPYDGVGDITRGVIRAIKRNKMNKPDISGDS